MLDDHVTTVLRQRPLEVRVMALMCLFSATTALLAVLAPMTDQAPTALTAACAGLALALAAAVWTLQHRLVLLLALVVHVVGISLLVAASATGVGAAGGMVTQVWVALYAAFFLDRRAARAVAALSVAALGAALLVNPFVGAAHLWVLVALTTGLASEVVSSAVSRLDRAAVTDPLTGALNRQGLAQAATRALAHAARSREPLTVVAVDLDGFKQVNDRHGHAAGDALLVQLVQAWSPELRADDVLARHGGDEFVLVLPDSDQQQAGRLLERLRRLSPAAWSAGLATAAPGDSLADLLQTADRALYASKPARAVVPAQRRPSPAAHTTTAGLPAG